MIAEPMAKKPPKRTRLEILFESDMLDKLTIIADRKGLSVSSYSRMVILEAIEDDELKREQIIESRKPKPN